MDVRLKRLELYVRKATELKWPLGLFSASADVFGQIQEEFFSSLGLPCILEFSVITV